MSSLQGEGLRPMPGWSHGGRPAGRSGDVRAGLTVACQTRTGRDPPSGRTCPASGRSLATTSSARVLPTPDESVANQLFLTIFFCHNIFFLSKLLPREKKIFFGKKIGWQHSHQGFATLSSGSTMMSTTSIGCQIHSFDATKMVCTKK